jgi:hypothetical protein
VQILFENDGNPMNTAERLKAWANHVQLRAVAVQRIKGHAESASW